MAAFYNADPIVGMVYVGLLIIDGNQKNFIPPPYVTRLEGNLYNDLLIDPLIVYPSNTTIRKSCLLQAGMFDERFPAGEDWDLWIRLAEHYHFKYINDVLTSVAKKEKPHFTRHEMQLAPEQWAELESQCNHQGVSPSSLLLTLFSEVLPKWSKSKHICLNMTVQ